MLLNRFRHFVIGAGCAVAIVLGTKPVLAMPASDLGPLASLQLSLATMSLTAPGEVGVAVEDIPTGKRADVHGDANMPAASVIKIPVMVQVFHDMAEGDIDLNDKITLEARDRDWGWGDLANAKVGTIYTVNTLLRLMITESDNTATNMLIRKVRRERINATMRKLDLDSTVLGDDIRSNGDIRSLRTSPDDMVTLLNQMAHEKLVDAWSSREMLAILAGQQHNGLLPVPLPHGLEIAHKTGTLHDTLNDVGIVFLNNDPYAIAVMTTHLPTLDAGRTFIRNVSKVAYEAFSRPHFEADLMDDAVSHPVDTAIAAKPVRQPRAAPVKAAAGENNDDIADPAVAADIRDTRADPKTAALKPVRRMSKSPSVAVAKDTARAGFGEAPEMQMWDPKLIGAPSVDNSDTR